MAKPNTKQEAPAVAKTATQSTGAPVLVQVIQNRTQIGKAICAAGKKLHLPLDQAKTLEGLGKVRILGI